MKTLYKSLTFIFLFLPTFIFSQVTYTLDNSKSSAMIIGSSNLHDEWTQQVKRIDGTLTAILTKGKLEDISNLKVTFHVTSIDGGKKLMNKKTYETLQAEKYRFIVFELNDIKEIANEQGKITITATGTLTISGHPETIEISAKGNIEDKQLIFHGSKKIDMTTLGITPPRALLGTLQTDEVVTIQYKLVYNK